MKNLMVFAVTVLVIVCISVCAWINATKDGCNAVIATIAPQVSIANSQLRQAETLDRMAQLQSTQVRVVYVTNQVGK
jgi:uncharacterized protein YxeA